MSKKKQKKNSFSLDFKKQSAQLILKQGLSIREAARNLGIPSSTLHTWVQRYQNGTWVYKNKEKKPNNPKDIEGNKSLQQKVEKQEELIKELQAELTKTKMEREIIKKAVAYFANLEK